MHVCAQYCGLWPCSTGTRKPVMRPSVAIQPPDHPSAYHACATVTGTLSGAVNIHQKQLLRSDVRISVLLCELLPHVPRTVDWKGRGRKKSIKNTIAMLPSGLTEMWHREELDFCSFMFPWPFERGRKKRIQLLFSVIMLKVQSIYNTLAPEVWEQSFMLSIEKSGRESWGVKIFEQKLDELKAKPLSQVSVLIGV